MVKFVEYIVCFESLPDLHRIKSAYKIENIKCKVEHFEENIELKFKVEHIEENILLTQTIANFEHLL